MVTQLPKVNSRVTAREFYSALLEIKPELQSLHQKVDDLYESINGSEGLNARLKRLEIRHQQEDGGKRAMTMFARIAYFIFTSLVALASAFMGAHLN